MDTKPICTHKLHYQRGRATTIRAPLVLTFDSVVSGRPLGDAKWFTIDARLSERIRVWASSQNSLLLQAGEEGGDMGAPHVRARAPVPLRSLLRGKEGVVECFDSGLHLSAQKSAISDILVVAAWSMVSIVSFLFTAFALNYTMWEKNSTE